MGLIKRTIQSFLDTKVGSIINVALYIAGSAAIAAVIDYSAKLDLSNEPIFVVTIVGVVNLILVAIQQKFFRNK